MTLAVTESRAGAAVVLVVVFTQTAVAETTVVAFCGKSTTSELHQHFDDKTVQKEFQPVMNGFE